MNTETHTHTHSVQFNENEQFKHDIKTGLLSKDKEIPVKYIYDQAGTELLFNIMNSSHYPLAHREAGILREYQQHLALELENETFSLIEIGLGSGIDSRILIKSYLESGLSFEYTAINTSRSYLDAIKYRLSRDFPTLSAHYIHDHELAGLKTVPHLSKMRNVLIYLGSDNDNLAPIEFEYFLKLIRRLLNAGDYLLLGFDLRKKITELLAYFNHPDGLYQRLYLNALTRINRELNANFDINQFHYVANYNQDMESINHLLVSKQDQTVLISGLAIDVSFKKDEFIYLASDYKYREQQIVTLAENDGFDIVKMYNDPEKTFINTLWKINK